MSILKLRQTPFRSHLHWLTALLAALICTAAVRLTADTAPRDEVFYQIFLRSFCDSTGDRVGDLRGVESKLDYLKDLGVTSVLLTPIQPSPFYHNYFADSFEGVDPAYGTMADLRALVRACHARGMKLFLDQEIQYVTENHAWLKGSLGHADSEFSHYLLYNGAGNTQPESFFPGIPTLPGYDGRKIGVATVNLRDADVRTYFEKLFVSWVDPDGDGSLRDGVDGFRIDHMMDDLDNKHRLTDLFATFWRPVFAAVRARNPHARIIAEQADWGYGEDWLTRGGADMVFTFPERMAIVSFDKAKILEAIRGTAARTPEGKIQLTFIENHDTNRFSSEVGGNLAKEKIGAAFDVFLRGSPLIYYGQEIGMRGIQNKTWGSDANDIPVREAFRWTHDLDAPGSAAWYQGAQAWWINRYNRSDDGVSVEDESKDPNSLLALYRQLLHLRAARSEIQSGWQIALDSGGPSVIGLLRGNDSARALLVVNLAATPATVTFSGNDIAVADLSGAWVDLLHNRAPANPRELQLAPYEARILGTP